MVKMYPHCIEFKVIILIQVVSKYEVNRSSSFLLICEADDTGSSNNGIRAFITPASRKAIWVQFYTLHVLYMKNKEAQTDLHTIQCSYDHYILCSGT